MSNPCKANWSKQHNGIRVRVLCPSCGFGGAQYIRSVQPKCSQCENILMHPANNTEIVCTWKEFKDYIHEKQKEL